MAGHRVRLTDHELALIVSALSARLAGIGPKRRAESERLALRLAEGAPGNPYWRFGWLAADLALEADELVP